MYACDGDDDDKLRSLEVTPHVDSRLDLRQRREVEIDLKFDCFQPRQIANDYFVQLASALLDPPKVSVSDQRQLREIDDGLTILDLKLHEVARTKCDVSHDENCCFHSFPDPKTIQSPSLNQAKPFEAFPSGCESNCGLECGVWAARGAQCNLKFDSNPRQKDLCRDPGEKLICDLAISVEFVVVVVIGRDDVPAVVAVGHFVDPSLSKYRKCDADNG